MPNMQYKNNGCPAGTNSGVANNQMPITSNSRNTGPHTLFSNLLKPTVFSLPDLCSQIITAVTITENIAAVIVEYINTIFN